MQPTIETWSGLAFDLSAPKPEMVKIEDLAKALSCICRYTGHCNDFYSVAQHSVLLANLTEFDGMGTPMQRLLHDSAEAYIGDMARPWKTFLFTDTKFNGAKRAMKVANVERRILGVIGKALGVELPGPDSIKEADNRIMMTEARDLMNPKGHHLFGDLWKQYKPLDYPIEPWTWEQSYEVFLRCYNEFKIAEEKNDEQPDTSEPQELHESGGEVRQT